MAKAVPSKGTQFWIEKGRDIATSLMITPTAISKAAPAVVTCIGNTAEVNAVVFVDDTGFPELDGKYFLVGSASTPTSLVLAGSNTTSSKGVLSTDIEFPPIIAVFVEGIDAYPLCVSSFDYDAGTAQAISVATFCDPSATIPGAPTDGTATFAGFTSPTDKGYRELMSAAHLQDKRTIYIRVPPVPGMAPTVEECGVVVLEGSINSYKESYAIGGAISWTSGMSLTRESKQIWTVTTLPFVDPGPPSANAGALGLPATVVEQEAA